ncbi:MAG: hypothetical protein JSS38_01535 [Nitrospira sp.]|nr:hypothetical protein [Nitrospira sp.]
MKRKEKGLTSPALHAAMIGRKVLAGLEKGRIQLQEINRERRAQGDLWRRVIAEYVLLDEQAGRSRRGRAGRIARKLNQRISERMVRKYLEQLTSGSDSQPYTASHTFQGGLAS